MTWPCTLVHIDTKKEIGSVDLEHDPALNSVLYLPSDGPCSRWVVVGKDTSFPPLAVRLTVMPAKET